ncbi:glycosyltransferase family 2 protein [Pseudovibrio exalbescens]|uniref:glycosyltransferase family 2 protein n=1 Tax=Pseudovibrio exalbescens TaxID=197461 RepID=UPI0009DB8664|nr:glycosyltransferase family A protein [Pseudovibrio exalbescens]
MMRNAVARWWSRQGDHYRALEICRQKDPQVLLGAGMFLSILDQTQKQTSCHAIAKAKLGDWQSALALASRLKPDRHTPQMYGVLAPAVPEEVLSMLPQTDHLAPVKAYCESHLGRRSNHHTAGLPHLHRLYAALKCGNLSSAKKIFAEAYAQQGLEPVSRGITEEGIDLHELYVPQTAAQTRHGPLISVVMTAYNEERWIQAAVRSLLRQTWQNLEIIIIDDGSTDRTSSIIQNIAQRDDRVRCVTLPKNIGLWAAKNVGIALADGEFVTMHDADDWSHPRKLADQVAPLLRDTNLQATSSHYMRIDEETGHPFTRDARNFLRWNPSSFLVRRSALQRIGNFYRHLLGADCEFIARLELFYGPRAHKRLKPALYSIGLNRSTSLSNLFRQSEGNQGALKRCQDWENWRNLHLGERQQPGTIGFGATPTFRTI